MVYKKFAVIVLLNADIFSSFSVVFESLYVPGLSCSFNRGEASKILTVE